MRKMLGVIAIIIGLIAVIGCSKKEELCCKPTVERVKDVICNMWIDKATATIKAEFDNADYYFCAEECKTQFLKNPIRYAMKCNCKSYNQNCSCEHCSGKRVPCDCHK